MRSLFSTANSSFSGTKPDVVIDESKSSEDRAANNLEPSPSVFDGIISWSVRNRLFVLCALILTIGMGLRSMYLIPIDAIPDLSENQVVLIAEWHGHSPREIEDHVTYPLVSQFLGIAGIKDVRSASLFGIGLLTLVFEEDTDQYFARARILERLESLPSALPEGVHPRLGPDANGLGWIYQYYLDVDPETAPKGGYDLTQLRSVQDWRLRYQLAAIPGVAEVASLGGFQREYQIEVNSFKLRDHGISLEQVLSAVRQSNLSVGAKVIEENDREFIVRGDGLLTKERSLQQLAQIAITEHEGTPVYLRELATITEGGAFRRGVLDIDGREAVGGIVVMRTGEDAREVTRRIENALHKLSGSLPEGISVKTVYDRSELIDRTVATLIRTMWKEMLIVTLVHILFFWHLRSVIIVTLPIPLAILGSFILMHVSGMTANVMSLGGIAIAIGVLVDAGIVMTENVLRLAASQREILGRNLTAEERLSLAVKACQMVGRPLGFAMMIIIVAFLPVFGLSGAEGKLFRPLAYTKTFAMVSAFAFTLTATPVLCAWLASNSSSSEERHWLMRFCAWLYEPVLDWVLTFRKLCIVTAIFFLTLSAILAIGLPSSAKTLLTERGFAGMGAYFGGVGSEFMPRLNEGSLLLMPVFDPGVSLNEVKRVMAWQDRVIRMSPEVRTVAGKLGRADTATDPAPIGMIETIIQLHPEYLSTNLAFGPLKLPWTLRNPQWRPGMTPAKLVQELTKRLSEVPGAVPGFLQPIENRILMLNTGIRGELGIKVLGDEAIVVQEVANRIQRAISGIQGIEGLAPSRQQGQPYVEVLVDRKAIAAHGLTVAKVLQSLETGVGGIQASVAIEDRERVPVVVRLQRSERTDIERLRDILVTAPNGAHLPLGMLATIRRSIGPAMIESENGRLRAYVQMNVGDRDLGGFVEEVRNTIAKTIEPSLPEGITIEYSGQWEDRERVRKTMTRIIPGSLLLIFMILLLAYRSGKEATHILLAVPFALSGGFALQYLLGTPFSAAVWVGYIALFGTAIQTVMVMVTYLDQAVREKKLERGELFDATDLRLAVVNGARLRLRPKLMTVVTIVASLLPLMFTPLAGAEVMKPLAVPIIGGMVSSLFHCLLVTPAIFSWLRQRELFPARRS
jgi:Cu(I)/Ag(I) efflux system membrane protein CusA/SilA